MKFETIKTIALILLISKYINELSIWEEQIGTPIIAFLLFAFVFLIKIESKEDGKSGKNDVISNHSADYKYSIFRN
ncbi:MAG: hypothetical protein MJZ34_13485 [Paludibacteraceae bacterium]|nr:hypothetical protein [Paludibacteraceae bacterium]